MSTWLFVQCPACRSQESCSTARSLQLLAGARMVRRDAAPEPDIVPELLRSAAGKLTCPQCLHQGLLVLNDSSAKGHRVGQPADDATGSDADFDEAFGQARPCEQCRAPIPAERLEIFPNSKLCARCQAADERGELRGMAEYCAHCGGLMQTRYATGRGLARMVSRCSLCGR